MNRIDQFRCENMELLIEIFDHKVSLKEVYDQKGPASSDYISLSIKLNILIKKYFEEKTLNLINMSKDELIEVWKQKGFENVDMMEASQKLDELIIKYQKLKHIG